MTLSPISLIPLAQVRCWLPSACLSVVTSVFPAYGHYPRDSEKPIEVGGSAIQESEWTRINVAQKREVQSEKEWDDRFLGELESTKFVMRF